MARHKNEEGQEQIDEVDPLDRITALEKTVAVLAAYEARIAKLEADIKLCRR